MFSSSGILCRRSNWNEIKLLHGHRTSCKRQKYSYLYFMQRKRDMGQSDVSIAPNSSAAAPEFLSFKSQQHSHSAINTWNSKILFPFLVKFLFFSNTETYYVEKKSILAAEPWEVLELSMQNQKPSEVCVGKRQSMAKTGSWLKSLHRQMNRPS